MVPAGMVERNGGGAEGSRTPVLLIANEALSQLSYSPVPPCAAPERDTLGRRRARNMLSRPGEVKRLRGGNKHTPPLRASAAKRTEVGGRGFVPRPDPSPRPPPSRCGGGLARFV